MAILRNARHERFAQEVAKGASTEEAFVAAGFKANSGNARRLKMNEAIKSRIEAILSERVAIDTKAVNKAIEKLALSKEWILSRLIENANRAMQAEQAIGPDGEKGEYRYEGSVANKALELLGKELGMFIDRKEIRTGFLDEVDPHELDQLRAALIDERARRARKGDRAEVPGTTH